MDSNREDDKSPKDDNGRPSKRVKLEPKTAKVVTVHFYGVSDLLILSLLGMTILQVPCGTPWTRVELYTRSNGTLCLSDEVNFEYLRSANIIKADFIWNLHKSIEYDNQWKGIEWSVPFEVEEGRDVVLSYLTGTDHQPPNIKLPDIVTVLFYGVRIFYLSLCSPDLI